MPFKVGDKVHKMEFARVSGEVTEVLDWGDAKVRWPDNTVTYEDKRWLELELPEKHTITIEIQGGCLIDVSGLPFGWDYELIDYDNEDDDEIYN